jgi:hypothetical protein
MFVRLFVCVGSASSSHCPFLEECFGVKHGAGGGQHGRGRGGTGGKGPGGGWGGLARVGGSSTGALCTGFTLVAWIGRDATHRIYDIRTLMQLITILLQFFCYNSFLSTMGAMTTTITSCWHHFSSIHQNLTNGIIKSCHVAF